MGPDILQRSSSDADSGAPGCGTSWRWRRTRWSAQISPVPRNGPRPAETPLTGCLFPAQTGRAIPACGLFWPSEASHGTCFASSRIRSRRRHRCPGRHTRSPSPCWTASPGRRQYGIGPDRQNRRHAKQGRLRTSEKRRQRDSNNRPDWSAARGQSALTSRLHHRTAAHRASRLRKIGRCSLERCRL